MEKIEFPLKSEWKILAKRPAAEKDKLDTLVATVFSEIEEIGDKAVLKYSKTFDKVLMESLAVMNADVENALADGRINPNPVIYVASAGLIPMSPTTEVVPVVDIPVFERTTKLPAVPRLTAAGPAASAMLGRARVATRESATTIEFLLNFFICIIYYSANLINYN